MTENKLSIKINKPVNEVFDYTIDSANTPNWIDSIVSEESNSKVINIGTIYKNKDADGFWNQYKVIEFERNKMFTLAAEDANYHVRYTYNIIDELSSELTYYEWMENGDLKNPFTIATLQKLKGLLENT